MKRKSGKPRKISFKTILLGISLFFPTWFLVLSVMCIGLGVGTLDLRDPLMTIVSVTSFQFGCEVGASLPITIFLFILNIYPLDGFNLISSSSHGTDK